MCDAIDAACRFVSGRKRADLNTDQMLNFALAHAYFDIDKDILWAAVQVSLPELKQALDACLERAGKGIPSQNS